jgi:hypothetical protein
VKTKWTLLAFVATLLGVAGAVGVMLFMPPDPLSQKLAHLPNSAKACEAQGGTWTQFGAGNYFCRISTQDAAKECTSSTQCQGVCLAASTDRNSLKYNACSSEVMLHGCFEEFRSGTSNVHVCQD